jgi:spermidine synthase
MQPARLLDRLIPALLVLTGATGLVYQVVIGRLFALHLGSSGASLAVTLATFLGGLSLGAALAGRSAVRGLTRVAQPVLVYALLEGCVGLWALALPGLSERAFTAFWAALQGQDPSTAGVLVAKLAVATGLILPLSTAMGATLPVLAAGVERMEPVRGVLLVSRYYAWNAAGAAVGALLAGFWLIEALGLELPLTLGALVNLLVALAVWRVFRDRPVVAGPGTAQAHDLSAGSAPRSLVFAAFATGLVALTCEVVWTRLHALLLGASVHAFASMLCVVITGIALGSALSARAVSKGCDAATVLWATQGLAGIAGLVLVLRLDAMPVDLLRLRMGHGVGDYGAWLALSGGYVALHLLPSALALGAAFPALLAAARARGLRTDRATAWMLAANTAGNLVGALGTGFLILPALGLRTTMATGALLSLAVAVLVAPRTGRLVFRTLPVALAAVAMVVLTVVPHDPDRMHMGLYRGAARSDHDIAARITNASSGQTLYRQDGNDASVLVKQYGPEQCKFRINGKADGGTGDVNTQVMLGHLGFLLRPGARGVLVVGLGTGQTAAAVASHPGTQVTVAELLPELVEVGRLFARWNEAVLQNPRVTVVVADAREVLRTRREQSLDLVVSEPSNPWVVGVADLYTLQHFDLVRSRLRPGGLLVQWIHVYELSDAALRSIVCTLHAVLPHVAVFRTKQSDLALVASAEPMPLAATAADVALAEPAVQRSLQSHRAPTLPTTLDTWLVNQMSGPATVAQLCKGFDAPLHALFPQLEYRAPRDFYAGRRADKVMLALDTRLDTHPDTWLPARLAALPLDAERRAALCQFLLANDRDGEQPLAQAWCVK